MERLVIWTFKTARFTVEYAVRPELELDCDYDTRYKIMIGEYEAFVAEVSVKLDGETIATDYLGQCIYSDYESFRDHFGSRPLGYGSYFSDMVRCAIAQARTAIAKMPLPPKMRTA